MSLMLANRTVLIISPLDLELGRDLVRGIREYTAHRHDWYIQLAFPHMNPMRPAPLPRPDGVLGFINNRQLAAAVRQLRCPVVNLSFVFDDLPFPRVGSNEAAIGRLAAEHFLERGFRRFGFFGYTQLAHSRARQAGYVARLREAGFACDCFAETVPPDPHRREPWMEIDPRVGDWVRSLPKPVAVFTPSPVRGFEFLEICRQAQLAVPHDVAVLGVDDDELVCGITAPPLSAVRIAGRRIGYEAAALLDRLFHGRPPLPHPLLIDPLGVTTRQSSNVLAVADDALKKAVAFMHAHRQRSVRIAEIAASAGLSRRRLERKFRLTFGTSPLQELRRLRVEAAQNLLSTTALPIGRVAEATGFTNGRRFSEIFRAVTGLTPGAYRAGSLGGRSTATPTRRL